MERHDDSHPELAYGRNPFFNGLAPYLPFNDMPRALERFPLSSVDVKKIECSMREALIEGIENHFVVTSEILEICSGIQILLRRALMIRNPMEKVEKVRMNRIGSAEDLKELKGIPSLDGAGMLLSGMTGMGKSALIKRVLCILVPQQVVTYGDSELCGWHLLTQCYYLYIDQPSNGTRGALLKRILMALDEQLGTTYFPHHERTANLDTLLVVVCKLLSAHRVAVLVIDENQRSNLADSPWSVEFVLFYHLLMNLGISVLLSGSPMAFDHLHAMGQVMRRFNTGGVHCLKPASSSSRWWTNDFVPGVRRFDLVDRWEVDEAWRTQFEYQHTGGLPGAYVALHREILRTALRRGEKSCVVTKGDFESAVMSPRYREVYRIARSICGTNATGGSEYVDVPGRGSSNESDAAQLQSGHTLPDEPHAKRIPIDQLKNRISALHAKHTKELNMVKKSLAVAQNLSPEDVRMLGMSEGLIRSMKEKVGDGKSERSVNGRRKTRLVGRHEK